MLMIASLSFSVSAIDYTIDQCEGGTITAESGTHPEQAFDNNFDTWPLTSSWYLQTSL